MSSILSSYWRPRPSTILPLDSATINQALAASGSFVTVIGGSSIIPSILPSATITSASAVTSSTPSLSPSPALSTSSVYSSSSVKASSVTSSTSSGLSSSSSSVPVTVAPPPAQETTDGSEEAQPLSPLYKFIILSIAGAILLTILSIFLFRQVRKQRQRNADVDQEKGNDIWTGPGQKKTDRWTNRWTKAGPESFWKRLQDYEESIKARPSLDTHIPSFPPPPPLTKEEASSAISPSPSRPALRVWHDVESGHTYDMVTPIQPRHITPPKVKPVIRLVARDEKAENEERMKLGQAYGNAMSVGQMFSGQQVVQDSKTPFGDEHARTGLEPHAITHSLRSSSSRERINKSAYPFHPPTAVSSSNEAGPVLDASSVAVAVSVPSVDAVNPFAENEEADTTAEIAAESVGNAMLVPSTSITIKRKPVPTAETLDPIIRTASFFAEDVMAATSPSTAEPDKTEPVVPSSTLLAPDYIGPTANPIQKRVTYRSPTESIYGCYQADDERQASFVDFSVSPKTLG